MKAWHHNHFKERIVELLHPWGDSWRFDLWEDGRVAHFELLIGGDEVAAQERADEVFWEKYPNHECSTDCEAAWGEFA